MASTLECNTPPAQKQEQFRDVLPRVFRSIQDHQRFTHRDIPTLDDADLWVQQEIVRDFLVELLSKRQPPIWVASPQGPLHAVSAQTWLIERLAALKAEIGGRHGN